MGHSLSSKSRGKWWLNVLPSPPLLSDWLPPQIGRRGYVPGAINAISKMQKQIELSTAANVDKPKPVRLFAVMNEAAAANLKVS